MMNIAHGRQAPPSACGLSPTRVRFAARLARYRLRPKGLRRLCNTILFSCTNQNRRFWQAWQRFYRRLIGELVAGKTSDRPPAAAMPRPCGDAVQSTAVVNYKGNI